MKRIVLHIDRLVLRGVDRGDAGAFTRALRGALHQALAVPDAASALAAQPSAARLHAAPAARTPGADARAQGHAVGQAIARQWVAGGPR